jgi:hypothetical protein
MSSYFHPPHLSGYSYPPPAPPGVAYTCLPPSGPPPPAPNPMQGQKLPVNSTPKPNQSLPPYQPVGYTSHPLAPGSLLFPPSLPPVQFHPFLYYSMGGSGSNTPSTHYSPSFPLSLSPFLVSSGLSSHPHSASFYSLPHSPSVYSGSTPNSGRNQNSASFMFSNIPSTVPAGFSLNLPGHSRQDQDSLSPSTSTSLSYISSAHWICPGGCGKRLNKNSFRSIKKHKETCEVFKTTWNSNKIRKNVQSNLPSFKSQQKPLSSAPNSPSKLIRRIALVQSSNHASQPVPAAVKIPLNRTDNSISKRKRQDSAVFTHPPIGFDSVALTEDSTSEDPDSGVSDKEECLSVENKLFALNETNRQEAVALASKPPEQLSQEESEMLNRFHLAESQLNLKLRKEQEESFYSERLSRPQAKELRVDGNETSMKISIIPDTSKNQMKQE